MQEDATLSKGVRGEVQAGGWKQEAEKNKVEALQTQSKLHLFSWLHPTHPSKLYPTLDNQASSPLYTHFQCQHKLQLLPDL